MSRSPIKVSVLILTGLWTSLVALPALGAAAQEAGTAQASSSPAEPSGLAGSPAPSAVPRLIRFSGVVSDAASKPAKGPLGITFSLYEQQEAGEPLWTETQEVEPDAQGRYAVLLGANSPGGLPLDLFASGAARWLGVQPLLPGVAEQPRVLLVGVPYALKAADADTLGGKPASAYVTTESQPGASGGAASAPTAVVVQAVNQALNAGSKAQSQGPLTVGGTGTTNYIPIWTNSTTLGNSTLFETGGRVGIGTTSPAGTLDVKGIAFIRGTLTLPALGTATGSTGFNSQPLDSLASAFDSGTHAAVSQHFRWQAEPVNNNTTSPSGKFNLLFASGSNTPAETGLSISGKGVLTFASGQTFPGAGTITGVTAGTDLTGGGKSGNVTLNLDTTKVPQLKSANTFTGNQSVTGNVSATNQLISTVATGTAPLSVKSTTEVPNLNANFLGGFPASAFAFVGGENVFVSGQFFTGNAIDTVVGDPGCGSGYAAIGFGSSNLFGCTSYSILGDGTNTYLNRPSGGTMHFREGNSEQMTIYTGGAVTMTTGRSDVYGLTVTASAGAGGLFSGGTDSSGLGGNGLVSQGGNSSASGTLGGDGIVAYNGNGPAGQGYAGDFEGNVLVNGNLSKNSGSFKIDHPLDPANKYLYHSFVESPDMKNIYDGVVAMNANGEAVVQLPDWFAALNRDFRYQLTCIGGFAPVYVAEEISNNQFKIAGGKPGLKVSWQVTGIRQDVWANAHRIPVEEEKNARERGYYLHPELYGAPEEKGIEWARHPEMMKRLKEHRGRSLSPQSSDGIEDPRRDERPLPWSFGVGR